MVKFSHTSMVLKLMVFSRTQAEVDGYVNANGEKYQSTAKAGDVRFVDFNGDGVISDADKTKIGKGIRLDFGLTPRC